jgi:tRNA dimethylallyltransferase
MKFDLVTILGPTALGKTRLAVELAYHFKGEIISADSRQVYKYMDIGTGKDLSEYVFDGDKIPYHLIDIIDPSEEFNLYLFRDYFDKCMKSLKDKGKMPILTGGTGLYIDSVLKGYGMVDAEMKGKRYYELRDREIEDLRAYLLEINKELHNSTDLLIKERIISAIIITEEKKAKPESDHLKYRSLTIGIKADRELLKKRITERLKTRLEEGMIEEVESLLKCGISHERLRLFGLEYKFISLYLKGELNYNDMYQKLNSAIHNFSKRQMTWFRKMEREGVRIRWIEPGDVRKAKQIIEENYGVPGD